ncbi:hypothetical protein CCB80_14950 [Armatimonadetes bacterium Uphvl-Ar1]|nr:hypothetical protein CCB80_14950 [Armatimonadetes bacterium Uphvl-Ar1]
MDELEHLGQSLDGNLPPYHQREIVLAWIIRLVFLRQVDPNAFQILQSNTSNPESPYTPFQLIRLTFERGLHEPSTLQKSRLPSPIPESNFICTPLESTEWWDETASLNNSPLTLPADHYPLLFNLATQMCLEDFIPHFPQHVSGNFLNQKVLLSASKNALRLKAYLHQNPELCQFDPSAEHLKGYFPPESMTREYKATFRFDTAAQQKNKHQETACLKTICAFLNSEGGTLIIGIDNALNPIGLAGDFSLLNSPDPQDTFLQIVSEAIKQRIVPYPHGYYLMQIVNYGPHLLLTIQVKPSPNRPHMLQNSGEEPALYIRSNNRTLQLKNQAQQDYLKQLNSTS